jgi:hypothetical protein
VNRAIKSGNIEGFYCVTLLTIEGIQKVDRAEVYAGSRIVSGPIEETVTRREDIPEKVRKFTGDEDITTFKINMQVQQNDRKPLHPEMIRRMQAAKNLGFRVLKAPPRIGQFQITDTTGEYYLDNGSGEELSNWINKINAVSAAIEQRGVGMAKIKKIGADISATHDLNGWYKALTMARDIHERRLIERAFSEWADGDSIAAHIAYGLDIFCTSDQGNSAGAASVLDSANKTWISSTYGTKFLTIEEVANMLP